MIAAFYLLKVILCSGLLLGYYWLALRNKAFHQWNRFYLLIITALSLLLPLIQFSIVLENEKAYEAVHYISMATFDESVVTAVKPKPLFFLSATQWLMAGYVLVSLILLYLSLKAVKEIVKVLRSYPQQRLSHFFFLNTNAKGAPFSFLNYMIWNRNIDLQSETGQHIFRHEMAHIQQKHTLDKIFLLIVLIPFWANPFFWIIRKELNAIHKFIADEKALQNGSTAELSRMILNALYPKQAYLLTSPFFQSSIKRRLQMFSQKNQKLNYMSRILVLPILFMVAVAFTVKQEVQKEIETFPIQQALQPYSDTIPHKSNVVVEEILKIPSGNHKEENVIVDEIKKSMPAKSKKNIQANVVIESVNEKPRVILDTIPKKRTVENIVFTKVEVEPKFASDWGAFLQKNLDAAVPVNNGAPAGLYEVRIRFIIDKEGNLSQFESLTKHGFGMEEAVIALLKKSPNWEPGQQNGRKVTAYKIQKVTFVVSEDNEQILAATNKLYIGIENPIKLDIGNANPKDLNVTISQGSIHNAGSYYVARVNTIGTAIIKVAVNENGKTRELASRIFAADVIQDKKIYFEKIEQQIKKFKQ